MKREEMNKVMHSKIIQSAIQEFNEKSYEKASMNHICQIGQISKGIIYHYFKDKDELYLECIKICFETLVMYYQKNLFVDMNHDEGMKIYMQLRIQFFREYPQLRGLFFHAILRTPSHLKEEVKMIKKDFDLLNEKFINSYLQNKILRPGVSFDRALEYYKIMQNAFNDYFRVFIENGEPFDKIVEKHEEEMEKWIDMVLHGIAEEDKRC